MCEVGAGMTAHGCFRDKRASVVYRLLYSLRGTLVAIGNV
jgi:hypothetical protein